VPGDAHHCCEETTLWDDTYDGDSPQYEHDLQPLQLLSLQPDLWCSQVLRKQGFLTLQVLQVLSHPETPWALGMGENWDDANTVCLCFLNGQSLCTLHFPPYAPSQAPAT
jgi:hypothetical protein